MSLFENLISRGVIASRPAAGGTGRLYVSTDETGSPKWYRDNGTSWDDVTPPGGGGGSATYPKRATMWHDESLFTVLPGGGTPFTSTDTAQRFNSIAFVNPNSANGDSFTNSFMLAAGTYSFSVLGATAGSNAKIDWYVDNVLIASGQDWYAATVTRNVTKTVTGVSIASTGYHVLKGVVNGKNASAVAYNMQLTKMWFVPAMD